MSPSIIHLLCLFILSVGFLIVGLWCRKLRKYIKELKGDLADERFRNLMLIREQKEKIETLRIRYIKPFDYVKGGIRSGPSFADVKQYMAEYITQQLIKDNILQIKDFNSYYEGSVNFVKSDF